MRSATPLVEGLEHGSNGFLRIKTDFWWPDGHSF